MDGERRGEEGRGKERIRRGEEKRGEEDKERVESRCSKARCSNSTHTHRQKHIHTHTLKYMRISCNYTPTNPHRFSSSYRCPNNQPPYTSVYHCCRLRCSVYCFKTPISSSIHSASNTTQVLVHRETLDSGQIGTSGQGHAGQNRLQLCNAYPML